MILWRIFIASQFLFGYIAHYNDRVKRERVPRSQINWSIYLQEVTSNVAITKKNEIQYVRQQLSIPVTQEVILDKGTPNI